MAVQNSVEVRNARLDSDETVIGASPIMQIRTLAQAADTISADTGVVLATLTLPADWMSAASAGSKAKLGTWEDTAADAAGTAAHYSIWNAALTLRHEQGSVTATGGGGDMTVDNAVFAVGQAFTVTGYTKTAGNA